MNLMVQFDYAVIGGGIAGISVAAELATSHESDERDLNEPLRNPHFGEPALSAGV
jgi:glycine/D-amino acid oxidase-like deaminating enzyme